MFGLRLCALLLYGNIIVSVQTHFKSCQSLHELAGLLCEFVMLCLNNFCILNGIIHLLIL